VSTLPLYRDWCTKLITIQIYWSAFLKLCMNSKWTVLACFYLLPTEVKAFVKFCETDKDLCVFIILFFIDILSKITSNFVNICWPIFQKIVQEQRITSALYLMTACQQQYKPFRACEVRTFNAVFTGCGLWKGSPFMKAISFRKVINNDMTMQCFGLINHWNLTYTDYEHMLQIWARLGLYGVDYFPSAAHSRT
jgi:hypothetical protein